MWIENAFGLIGNEQNAVDDGRGMKENEGKCILVSCHAMPCEVMWN